MHSGQGTAPSGSAGPRVGPRVGPRADVASVLRAWLPDAVRALAGHRAALDALNVFPVPDGDTGTNLHLTLGAAAQVVADVAADASAREVARAVARGALVGARGNSGIIVSQYLAALTRSLVGPADATGHVLAPDARRLAGALRDAEVAAYRSVARPAEGTVLTIARRVADAAGRRVASAPEDAPAADVLAHGLAAGYAALEDTGHVAPGGGGGTVRDSGAWGLLLVLDALLPVLGEARPDRSEPQHRGVACGTGGAGAPHPDRPGDDRPRGGHPGRHDDAHLAADGHGHGAADDCADDGGAYEVMAVLGLEDVAATDDARGVGDALREALQRVGGSVAVVEADGLWHVHVHTDDPVTAVGVGPGLGLHPRQVGVRHLLTQAGAHGAHAPAVGVVVVTTQPGLVAELARAGAVVVLAGRGRTVDPAGLHRAVQDTGARQVCVLVDDDAGDVQAPGPDPQVDVLEGLSGPQLVAGAATAAAASLGSDPLRVADEVRAAVHAMRCAAVEPVGGRRHADVVAVVDQLLDAEADLLVVVTSSGTPSGLADAVRAAAGARPGVDVLVLDGGGPGATVQLGAEGCC